MALQANLRKQIIYLIVAINRNSCLAHGYATKKQKKPEVAKRLDAVGASLSSKGFLRPNKSYAPPENVAEKVEAISKALQIPMKSKIYLENLEQKFKLLDACYTGFRHSVPSSLVHEMHTVADVISFYETAVDTTVPYEALKNIDLPENLHIQYDYLRFHPDTDTKFNGKTAFPKSSTLVTGLKYRTKYAGHHAKQSWP